MLPLKPNEDLIEAAKLHETSAAKLCTSAAASGSKFDMLTCSSNMLTDISKALVSISNTAVISILGTGAGVGVGAGVVVVVVDTPIAPRSRLVRFLA